MKDNDDKSDDKQIIHIDTQGKRVQVFGTNSASSFNTDQPGWKKVGRKEKTKGQFGTSLYNVLVDDIGAAFGQVSKYIDYGKTKQCQKSKHDLGRSIQKYCIEYIGLRPGE